MLDSVIAADDLTGACDAAVHFATRGRRTSVCLTVFSTHLAADVLAFSTDTRETAHDKIRERTDVIASSVLPLEPRVRFKKIDSVMRGCPGVEIAAALAAFRCDTALITPAFPAMGRTVRAGQLCVGETATLDVAARLLETGLPSCVQVSVGLRLLLCDADEYDGIAHTALPPELMRNVVLAFLVLKLKNRDPLLRGQFFHALPELLADLPQHDR
jgi:D-threonate/D-erythronate kinase